MKYKQFAMSNYNIKLLLIMEKQLEYYDLRSIKPGYNFIIICDDQSEKNTLKRNIMYFLTNKKCIIRDSYYHSGKYDIQYYSFKSKIFNIIIHSSNSAPSNYDNLDIVFIHSQCFNKNIIAQNYFKNGFIYDCFNYVCGYFTNNNKNNVTYINNISNYYNPCTFFVLYKNTIQLCKAEYETTYLTKFREMPYNYNNLAKLNNNILNGYSLYNKQYGKLHSNIQSKLKTLGKIHIGFLCLKHYDIWLPNELHLEIIKLLFLMHL